MLSPFFSLSPPFYSLSLYLSAQRQSEMLCFICADGMEIVSSGDILMVVESDKADMDVEAFEEG
jgi:hypothetical protein